LVFIQTNVAAATSPAETVRKGPELKTTYEAKPRIIRTMGSHR
jgi:hypothetical protein